MRPCESCFYYWTDQKTGRSCKDECEARDDNWITFHLKGKQVYAEHRISARNSPLVAKVKR